MNFCVVVILLAITGRTLSQALRREKETFLISCLKRRHWVTTEPNLIERQEDRDECLEFLESAASAFIPEREPKMQERTAPLQYLSTLVQWKNGRPLHEDLLEQAAPCWKYEPLLRSKWVRQFDHQKDAVVRMPKTISKHWDNGLGDITFRRMTPSFASDALIAAELIVARKSPASIQEHFGRYMSKVYVVRDGTDEVIHSDYQSSCPTKKGKYFILNLNLSILRKWYKNASDNLQIRIRIKPRRQYRQGSQGRNSPVDVVEDIVGLALHFKSTNDEPTEPSLLALLGSQDVPAQHKRHRRSVANRQQRVVRRKSCGIIPYRLPRSLYDGIGIIYPTYEDDACNIAECAGKCSYPLTAHMNSTNHAIAIGRGIALHGSEESRLSICCVPNSYKDLWYAKRDANGEELMDVLFNVIVQSCACL